MSIEIGVARPLQLPAVLALWEAAEAEPTHTDDLEGLSRLVEQDPGALILALDTGRILGSIIAGWDGWRGSIYRLAVHPEARHQGVGHRLLAAAEDRLAALGGRRLQAFVVSGDQQAMGFWRSTDWDEQVERVRFVKG